MRASFAAFFLSRSFLLLADIPICILLSKKPEQVEIPPGHSLRHIPSPQLGIGQILGRARYLISEGAQRDAGCFPCGPEGGTVHVNILPVAFAGRAGPGGEETLNRHSRTSPCPAARGAQSPAPCGRSRDIGPRHRFGSRQTETCLLRSGSPNRGSPLWRIAPPAFRPSTPAGRPRSRTSREPHAPQQLAGSLSAEGALVMQTMAVQLISQLADFLSEGADSDNPVTYSGLKQAGGAPVAKANGLAASLQLFGLLFREMRDDLVPAAHAHRVGVALAHGRLPAAEQERHGDSQQADSPPEGKLEGQEGADPDPDSETRPKPGRRVGHVTARRSVQGGHPRALSWCQLRQQHVGSSRSLRRSQLARSAWLQRRTLGCLRPGTSLLRYYRGHEGRCSASEPCCPTA